MKTYINGQHKSADTEMATKYQLSRAYTKVQTHINTVKDNLSSAINSTDTNLNALNDLLSQKQQVLISKDNQLQAAISQLDFNTTTNIQAVSSQVSINISNINSISGQLDINVESLNNMINAVSAEMQEADQSLSSIVDIAKDELSAAIDTTKAQLTLYVNERDEAILNQANANLQTAIDNLGNIYELKGFYTKSDNTIATSIADLPLNAEKGDIYFITNNETGQTQQYICVQPTGVLSNERWQKFGTSVDLRKYATTGYVDDNVNLLKTKCELISSSLDTNITNVNSNLNTLITETKTEVEAKITETKAEVEAKIIETNDTLTNVSDQLKTYKISNNNNITTLVETITSVTTTLNNADTSLDGKINTANDNINVINSNIDGLSSAIDNTNATILVEKENIINILTNNDNVVSAGLEAYVDEKISNLGTVYELKGFYTKADNTIATSIADLPTSATVGQIYFIQNAETGQTEQYICIAGEEATLAANKWQKFGTNVDLANYVTNNQMTAAHQQLSNELVEEINRVSGSLNTSLTADINTSLNSAKEYADTKDSQVLTNAKAYTDQVSSAVNNDLMQKINSSLNTANQFADTQDAAVLASANDNAKAYTDQVSSFINNNLMQKVDRSLNSAKEYADAKDSQVLTNAKAYTDQVSSAISRSVDDLSSRLTNDIGANAKEYTNLAIASLNTVYCQIRKIEEIAGSQPDFGTLSGNITYKFTDPLQSLTVNTIQDSDLQTLVYFTTASTIDTNLFANGIPLTELIDNGLDFTNIQPDTKYLLTIRNSIGKIEKIKTI